MFIPFLGAVISAASLGDNALAEARVGLAGPVLGTHRRGRCASLIWQATGSDFWRALAFTGFFLNLFNLLPVVPLDGGRAMAAMAPWMWFVGFAALIALVFVFPQPDHPDHRHVRRRWRPTGAGRTRKRGGAQQRAYYRVSAARPGAGRRRLPRPDRAAGRRHGRDPPAAHVRLELTAATLSRLGADPASSSVSVAPGGRRS